MGSIFSWTKDEVLEYPRLGNGAFGTVYHVNYWLYSRDYAVKVIDIPNEKIHQMALKEVETLRQVGFHRNVVQLYSCESTADCDAMLIWMEYCELGDLHRVMKKYSLDKCNIISLMKQLCDAVNHIHSKNIIHRDIKPANILLRSGSSSWEPFIVKLADFGIGNFAECSAYFEQKYFKTLCGTPKYVAPEVMLSRKGYHKSADIYSMGVLLEELVGIGTDVYPRGGLYTLSQDMKKWQPKSRPTGSEVRQRLSTVRDEIQHPRNLFYDILRVSIVILIITFFISPYISK